jgi:hypothetical protein
MEETRAETLLAVHTAVNLDENHRVTLEIEWGATTTIQPTYRTNNHGRGNSHVRQSHDEDNSGKLCFFRGSGSSSSAAPSHGGGGRRSGPAAAGRNGGRRGAGGAQNSGFLCSDHRRRRRPPGRFLQPSGGVGVSHCEGACWGRLRFAKQLQGTKRRRTTLLLLAALLPLRAVECPKNVHLAPVLLQVRSSE